MATTTPNNLDELAPQFTASRKEVEEKKGFDTPLDWEFDDPTLKNILTPLSPFLPRSVGEDDWYSNRYSGFPDEELVRAYRLTGDLAFEEVDIYLSMRDQVGDYVSWTINADEAPPPGTHMKGAPNGGMARYITSAAPGGGVEHRWYVFKPDEYPDLATRSGEQNWLHERVHTPGGSCPICGD